MVAHKPQIPSFSNGRIVKRVVNVKIIFFGFRFLGRFFLVNGKIGKVKTEVAHVKICYVVEFDHERVHIPIGYFARFVVGKPERFYLFGR